MGTTAKLKSIEVTEPDALEDHFGYMGEVVATFIIRHSNDETTVEQEMVLRRSHGGWKAEIAMDDFPLIKTSTAAAWKLADWMERLAEAIKDNTFSNFDLNGL